MSKWRKIESVDGVEQFRDSTCDLHDSALREFLLIGPDFVDEASSLHLGETSNALALVHSQFPTVKNIALIFEDIASASFEPVLDLDLSIGLDREGVDFQALSLKVRSRALYWTAGESFASGRRLVTSVDPKVFADDHFGWLLSWPEKPASL